jgi:hypothetical protein
MMEHEATAIGSSAAFAGKVRCESAACTVPEQESTSNEGSTSSYLALNSTS